MRAALAAVCLVLACSRAVPNLDSSGRTIVCFGDSLTAGVGRGDGPTYPQHLAQQLGAEVINAGVPGDTASQALRRIDRVLASDPWLVIVELGGNDILRRVPLETTESALRGIVERLLDAGVVPMLLEVRGPFGRRYSKLFDRLERSYGTPVIRDVLPELLLDRRYKSDAIHLNAAGYERLAREVARRIEPLMQRRLTARTSHHEATAKPYVTESAALSGCSPPRHTDSMPASLRDRMPCIFSNLRLLATLHAEKSRLSA